MTLPNNIRYAFRQLRKSPAFTLTVLATLALCIGANTAIYSVVDTLFFRPLPYHDPARLVMITTTFRKAGMSQTDTSQDGHTWELIRDHASFLDSAVYGSTTGVNLFAAGRVEFVQQQKVSANYFKVLGVPLFIGREFSQHEDIPGGPTLTILSYGVWHGIFNADPAILGRTVNLRGAPYTVVGIMPPSFQTGQRVDLWTPLQPSQSGEGGGDNYGIIGRLRPGVTFAQADAQLNSLNSSKAAEARQYGYSVEQQALPLQAGFTTDIKLRITLMWAAVGLVLIIGCVNIAGILLSRSGARSQEIATRMALGASRGRIIWQLLTESVLLAIGGGVFGIAVGQLALRGLLLLNPDEFQIWSPIQLDLRVMGVMLLASLFISILFGLFPAFEATAVNLRSALAEGGRGSAGTRRQWKRQSLVFLEVALGVTLVCGAGLLIRTFTKLTHVNPGFNPSHIVTASVSLQDARYTTAAAGTRLFRESLDRMRQIPGVESAAVALTPPYARPLNLGIKRVAGQPVTLAQNITDFSYVTPGFFETLQIPLLRGRVFTTRDNAAGAKVMVINQAFVQRYFGKTPDPIGSSVESGGAIYQVIGVVESVQQKNGWGSDWGPIDAFAQAYVPSSQVPDDLFVLTSTWFSPTWIVRTRGDVRGLPDAMQRALKAVDPQLPFSSFKNMSEIRGASLHEQRYQATLFSALAGLAILLAALGVYGLIAQSVAQRTREMGIRLALGATVPGLIRTAATPGIVLSVAGIACGLLLSLFATRLLKSLLWNVSATDPTTFAAVAIVLVVVAALSSVVPALRLTRLDPAQTLRNE